MQISNLSESIERALYYQNNGYVMSMADINRIFIAALTEIERRLKLCESQEGKSLSELKNIELIAGLDLRLKALEENQCKTALHDKEQGGCMADWGEGEEEAYKCPPAQNTIEAEIKIKSKRGRKKKND